jgi:hypothetical protein
MMQRPPPTEARCAKANRSTRPSDHLAPDDVMASFVEVAPHRIYPLETAITVNHPARASFILQIDPTNPEFDHVRGDMCPDVVISLLLVR